MPTQTHEEWIGRMTYDAEGNKVGEITDIYADDATGQPEWLTIKTGWLGTREHFVPIVGTTMEGDHLRLGYRADTIKDAPTIDTGNGHLDQPDEDRLYRHYGFDPESMDYQNRYGGMARADEGYEYERVEPVAETQAPPQQETGTMVRSEEDLDIRTTEHETGRARLRKYVVTEEVNVTVPVRKQVARITRHPVSDTGEVGDAFTEDEQEVVLAEEEIEVIKRTVPKEEVGLDVETVTENREVHEQIRKERIEAEGAEEARGAEETAVSPTDERRRGSPA